MYASSYERFSEREPTVVLDKRVYDILKHNCDAPRVVFSAEDVFIVRHSSLKRVLLVSTRFYTYIIKQKGYKFYTRFANRRMTVFTQQENLVISASPSTATAVAPDPLLPTTALTSEETQHSEFEEVKIECDSSFEANRILDKLTTLILSAQHTAAQLEQQERGVPAGTATSSSPLMPQEDEAGSESSGSDNEGDAGGQAALARPARPLEGKKATEGMLEMAPSRYIAITSLVDGEFADYTTLKNAYMRHEENELLSDLTAFIKENEGQVELLCEHHYPSFIHATQQCLTISERDAQLVGEELSGASTLVKSAVVNMKQVASSMVLSRSTRENLLQTRTLLRRAQSVVEYLETAETQVSKEQLMGALASMRELVRLSAPMVDYALGEYVMRMRVPALTAQVFEHAVHHMNDWLRLLRSSAEPIGSAALEWHGHVTPAFTTKHIVTSADGNEWWMEDYFIGSSLVPAAFDQADAVARIAHGAAIQNVFQELRRDDYFVRAFAEGRAQLLRADIIDAPLNLQAEGLELVAGFQQHCCVALGFMLTEDIVFSATSPHAHSRADVLRLWDQLSHGIADRVRRLSDAMASLEAYGDLMTNIFEAVRNMMQCTISNVKNVDLSPLILSRVVESVSDNLISRWLQGACMDCAQLILSDTFTAMTVNSKDAFEKQVARFYFNHCPRLELPIPAAYTSGTVTLPFSPVVSAIGDKVLQFLTRCYSVIITEQNSAFRQSELNNVDEMVLKYISVLFRTVSETLQAQLGVLGSRDVLPLAVFVTSCSVMPVVVTCVEQQFMLRWSGDYGSKERQAVGCPKLLAATAAFFNKPLQKGIEGLLDAFRGKLEERLAPTKTFSYWKKQLELRRGGRKRSEADSAEGFAACVNYAVEMVPKMKALLQTTVVRSVVGAALTHAAMMMQNSITVALSKAHSDGERDFALMRELVQEYSQQCAEGLPVWQRQLAQQLPESGASQLPLSHASTVTEMNQWIDAREQKYVIEKSNQPQILAGMAKGLQAVGKTVTATANVTASVFGKKD